MVALLTEISNRRFRWLSFENILQYIVRVVFETVPVERGLLLLVDARTGAVETHGGREHLRTLIAEDA